MDRIDLIPFKFPNISNVRCAFTTRSNGNSATPFDKGNLSFEVGDDPFMVRKNRTALASQLGLKTFSECIQIHSDIVHFNIDGTSPEAPPSLEGDAITTVNKGQGLIIKTADCQPILIAHKKGKFVVGIHNGWRGNSINFPTSAIEKICSFYDCEPSDLAAVRGPSLSPKKSEFINFSTDFPSGFEKYFNEVSKCLDLWEMTKDQLHHSGIAYDDIYSLDLCTYEMNEYFFSYRRKKETGRQLSIIWID